MKRWTGRVGSVHDIIAKPGVLVLILAINAAAYFGGLILWYGYVMQSPETPVWVWPFVPDCPLFGLLGALALMMVTARVYWTRAAQVGAQKVVSMAAGVSVALWLSTYVSNAGNEWAEVRAAWALWAVSLAVCAVFFRRTPAWLLAIIAFGQIKYGIWTITAWSLFWRNTSAALGSPLITADSVLMTVTHVGLAAQGALLLTYFRPDLVAVAASFGWFAVSDFIDYGLGYFPAVPEEYIPPAAMQWSTVTVTIGLSILFLWWALYARSSHGLKVEPASSRKQGTSQFV
jgi:uncharacterized membrane protein YpjA